MLKDLMTSAEIFLARISNFKSFVSIGKKLKKLSRNFSYLFSGMIFMGLSGGLDCDSDPHRCSSSAICFNLASAWPVKASNLPARFPSEVILTLDGGMTGNLGPKLDFLGDWICLLSWPHSVSSSEDSLTLLGKGSITTSTKPRLFPSIRFSRSSEDVLEADKSWIWEDL